MTYKTMYKKAVDKIFDYSPDHGKYKGYTGINAISLYVYDKYGVNATSNSFANEALCEIVEKNNIN